MRFILVIIALLLPVSVLAQSSGPNGGGFLEPYQSNAYGPGINSDATGRPFSWQPLPGNGPADPSATYVQTHMGRVSAWISTGGQFSQRALNSNNPVDGHADGLLTLENTVPRGKPRDRTTRAEQSSQVFTLLYLHLR